MVRVEGFALSAGVLSGFPLHAGQREAGKGRGGLHCSWTVKVCERHYIISYIIYYKSISIISLEVAPVWPR